MLPANRPPPTFIVGVPRSGTTLLAATMNAHRSMSCGNETHFFEPLTGAVAAYLTDRRRWPGRAAGYMASLNHMGNSVFSLYQVDMRDYVARLRGARPAVSAILECFMGAHLSLTGKSRWAEKTPGHLKRFTAIRAYFPTARVICIFRDPRDVARSLLNVPWGTARFLDGLIMWRSYYNYYKRHIEGDRLTLAIRYEDLVREPGRTARGICTFLGEAFDEGMLDRASSAADVGSSLEPYKSNASDPADATRAFAWKSALGSTEVALCNRLLPDALPSLGYVTPATEPAAQVSVYPFDQLGTATPVSRDPPKCPAAGSLARAWR